jgi:hypothetical protein
MDAYEQLLHVFFFFEKLAVTPWGCLDSLFSGVAARKSEKVRKARQTLCAFSAVQRRSQNPDFRRRRRLLRTRVRKTKPNRPHVSLKNRSRFALSIAIQG